MRFQLTALLIAVALAVAIGVEKSAVAGPYYYVETTQGATKEGAEPVYTEGSSNRPPGSFAPWDPAAYTFSEGSARAYPGSLSTRALGEIYFPFSYPFISAIASVVGSRALFIIDDFVLSGPGSTVSGSLQLRLSGGVSANAVLFGQTTSYGVARGAVNVSGDGFVRFSGSRVVTADTINGLQPMVESGVLVGGGGLISVPFVDAPVGTPLTLYLALQASASGQVYGDANGLAKVTATGSSAFYETLSFDTSGPAFIMPQGYRADSPTARVENSIFIPEPPPGDYNNDGKVDAADYVVWRKTGGSQAEYDTWRANFGMSLNGAGAGSSLASGATLVPEPGTLWLSWLVLAGTIVFICRRRMALN